MPRSIIIFLIGYLLLIGCTPINAITATVAPPTDTPPPSPTVVWFPPSATPTLIAIPTYTATPDMQPGIGSLIFADDFTDISKWDTVDSPQASASLTHGKLTLAVEPGGYIASLHRAATLTNFYAELNAQIGLCRGDDAYGLILRANGNSFYRLFFSCNGSIRAERIKDSVRLPILDPIFSGDIPLGPPGAVKIGVWANGGELRVFLNDRYQVSLNEKTFPSGALGFFVQSKGDTPLTMSFSDLKVYAVNYIQPVSTATP